MNLLRYLHIWPLSHSVITVIASQLNSGKQHCRAQGGEHGEDETEKTQGAEFLETTQHQVSLKVAREEQRQQEQKHLRDKQAIRNCLLTFLLAGQAGNKKLYSYLVFLLVGQAGFECGAAHQGQAVYPVDQVQLCLPVSPSCVCVCGTPI